VARVDLDSHQVDWQEEVRSPTNRKRRDEGRREISANGTIRQELLVEVESTRNLFELQDLQYGTWL
jgi:hypothetical protein